MKAMAEKSLLSDWQIILMPPLFFLFQFTSEDSTLRRGGGGRLVPTETLAHSNNHVEEHVQGGGGSAWCRGGSLYVPPCADVSEVSHRAAAVNAGAWDWFQISLREHSDTQKFFFMRNYAVWFLGDIIMCLVCLIISGRC